MRKYTLGPLVLFALVLPLCAQEDVDSLTKQARQELSSGDYVGAAKDFQEALAAAKAGRDGLRMYLCDEGLATVSERQNDLDQAERWLVEGLATLQSATKVSPMMGLLSLDNFYLRHHMPAKRVDTLKRVISIWSTTVGPDAIGTARYQAELGESFNKSDDSESAEEPLRHALSVLEGQGAIYVKCADRVKRDLFVALSAQGKTDEAAKVEATLIPELHLSQERNTIPQRISEQAPQYSEAAIKLKISGSISLSVDVDETGKPQNVQIVWPLGEGLDENAIKAVAASRFRPATRDGAPVVHRALVEVNLRLF